MRLLIVLPVPLPGVGGLETHYSEIISYFSSLGASLILLCPKHVGDKSSTGSFEVEMKKKSVKVLRIPVSPPSLYYQKAGLMNYISLFVKILTFWTISAFYTIVVVKKYRPQSCLMRHSLLFYPLPYVLKLFKVRTVGDGDALSSSGVYFFFNARTLAKHSLAKKELTQNTIFVRTAIQIIEKLEREMFSKYDYFRAISPFLASDPQLKKLISNEKIVMIPPAVDMSRIPYSRNCANDVAYFGILEKFEGLETLIQSFARVLIQHPFVKLHIFGDGPLRQTLQEVAGELGIASSVIFYGNLPRDELFHHFNKFSIAVFPRFSGYGHIPIKIIEALAAGKAVIATMVNGIEDIFSSNEVLLVNPGDEEQLSQAIITGLREGGLRKKLSYHGLIRAKDFDSSKVYKELFNLLIIKRG